MLGEVQGWGGPRVWGRRKQGDWWGEVLPGCNGGEFSV